MAWSVKNTSAISGRWVYIPMAMAMSMVALALARLSYGFMLPFMREDLQLSFEQSGFLGTATSLGYLISVLPAGYLTRRSGPRRVIITGLLLVTCGFFGLYTVSLFVWLFACMVVLGTGTALIYTPVVSFIVGWFPEKRGMVLGTVNSGIGLGVFICGLTIPYLAVGDAGDEWRQVWGWFAMIAGAVAVLALWLLIDPAIAEKPASGYLPPSGSVYRSSVVRVLGLCYFLTGFSYIVQSVFMYSYALESGVRQDTAGAMASLAGVLSIFSGFMWGTLSDLIGRSAALFFCFSGAAIATLLPVFISTDTGFLAHYVLSGLTVSGLFATIVAATSEYSAPSEIPVAIGFVTTLLAVGQLIGPALAGWVIENSGSFRLAFTLSAVSMAIGALMSLLLGQIYRLNRAV